MKERNPHRRCLINRARDDKRLRFKGGWRRGHSGRDVVVQGAVRAGDEAQLPPEIQDVRGEDGTDDHHEGDEERLL